MTKLVDVAIIGAGGAGYPAAFRLAAAGREVLMADPIGNLGGDCLAEGCVPSKAVREAALSYQRARRGPLADISGPPGPDLLDATSRWHTILRRKDAVQQMRYDQHRNELKESAVHFVAGGARVVDENELEVETDAGEVRRVGFHSLVIATGSAPSRLPIPGAELAATSHELFRLGADLVFPHRPVIIGGGYIGVETATILEHLGAAPVILELTDQLLPGFDRDLADFLARSLRGRVRLELGAAVTGIERSGTDFVVRYRSAHDSTEDSVVGDLVVMATGRVPVLPDGIEHLTVKLDHHRAPLIDATIRTTNPSVWAPGDVNGKSMLFHSAVRQSIVVAHNILAGGASADRMDFTAVPFTVFTDPELASVGLTEAKAAEQHRDVVVGSYDYTVDARAQILGETIGYLKLLFDAHSARLLGAQIAGVDAAHLVAPLALALNEGLDARALAEVAFPHPMISEGINAAARQILV
ncbi:dihydrolipoyl dehydrogenase [Mycobacterium botniense]|nr:dihydrolipoyl dehydrogenase [Mycobacterium botniense]